MREKRVFIKWNLPCAYLIRSNNFRLIPGLNEVRVSIWEAVKNNPGVKERLKDGRMELKDFHPDRDQVKRMREHNALTGEDQTDEGDKLSSLDEYDPKDAKEIVAECLDKELLEQWYETEKRDSVKKMIKVQIKKLTLDKNKKKGKSDKKSAEE